jgi:DNA-binding NarL/FixJ family response regulator
VERIEVPGTRESLPAHSSGGGDGQPLRIPVAAIDDHPVVLAGLRQVLPAAAPDITIVAAAPTVQDLLAGPGRHAAVVLLDLLLRDGEPVADNVARTRDAGPQVVIFTSDLRPVPLRAAMAAGALGLVLKADPVEQIAIAVRTCRMGRVFVSSPLAHALATDEHLVARLSTREVQVLAAVARGLPYKLIARQLDIEASTVRAYLERAMTKYAAIGRQPRSTHELVAFAIRDGHLELPAGG